MAATMPSEGTGKRGAGAELGRRAGAEAKQGGPAELVIILKKNQNKSLHPSRLT